MNASPKSNRYLRRLRVEPLETRRVLAANVDLIDAYDARDVDRDGQVSPADALAVMNTLNESSSQGASSELATSNFATDVNGDGVTSPVDVLLVVNTLNAQSVDDSFATAAHAAFAQTSARTSAHTAGSADVLFLRGGSGTGGFLEGGGDDQLADIGDYSTDGGNHGWGELADTLVAAGFTLEQWEEGSGSNGDGNRIPLSTMDLSSYEVIVFGSNNAEYTEADVDAIEEFVMDGGGVLFISDANFGSDWADASDSDQQFLDRIGVEVHQDQGTYRVGSSPGEILVPSHPLFAGVSSFDGEGVTPFHVVQSVPGVQVTLLAGAEGNTRLNQPPFGSRNRGPSRNTNDDDAAVFVADWGFGRVVGHFDRNTFFNVNGAGTNINRFDNQQYAVNLFTFLAGTPLLGDYDGNCLVDNADQSRWFNDFGSSVDLEADGNGDGIVDAADFTVWRDNFGNQCD